MFTSLAVTALSFSTGSLLGILLWVAVLAVVVWAVIALVRWSGVPIPQPVIIILTALVAIFLIILLFRAFGMLV